jgi:hypothetical protein
MINAVAPRTYQSRAAFGNEKDGKMIIKILDGKQASKFNGILHIKTDDLSSFGYHYIPTIEKSFFNKDKGTISLQVAKNACIYDQLKEAVKFHALQNNIQIYEIDGKRLSSQAKPAAEVD